MTFKPQIKIPATYMRGGTSKGVFFNLTDLPEAAQVAGDVRDNLLLRVIGSPDPYGKQTDGMGGATSSTSKTVILSKSDEPDHDVDYLFGQVAIDKAFVVLSPSAMACWIHQEFQPTVWQWCAFGKPISRKPSSRMCQSPMDRYKKLAILN